MLVRMKISTRQAGMSASQTLSLGVAAARADEMSARAWARRHEGNER